MKPIFLVLVGIASAVTAGCGMVEAKEELESVAAKVLAACQEGRYEDVYRDASQAFRDSTTLDDLREYVEQHRKILGAFRRIAKTDKFGYHATNGQATGKLSLEVEYERGPAQVDLEFRKDGGTWRLSLLKMSFEEKFLPQPDRAVLEPLARELLTLYDSESFVALYGRFSKPLQKDSPAATYEPQIRDLRAKTGKVLEATLREITEQGPRLRLLFALKLESGPGEADLAFEWDGAGWQLMEFHVQNTPR